MSRGEEALIVATPGNPLERRVLDRLSRYMRDVLRADVRVVGSTEEVPVGGTAVMPVDGDSLQLSQIGEGSPGGESVTLRTGETGGRPVVVTFGASQRGLKRAVQRLSIVSRQTEEGLMIPPLKISEFPWIPKWEWTLCPWNPASVRGVFHNRTWTRGSGSNWTTGSGSRGTSRCWTGVGFSGGRVMQSCITYALLVLDG